MTVSKNYSKTWFGANARFESRWWSCFPSDFSSGAAFTLAYSSNNLSESINASLNKQISDRSKLNFPRACALLAEWKRSQMESLLLIRRLNVPSRSSNETLISHAMRYRFQKRLNDLVRNQRVSDREKIHKIMTYSQLLGEASRETKNITRNRHVYARWFENICKVSSN